MKIAICISGHMRCYKQLTSNQKQFFKRMREFGDVDVFLATWDKQASLGSSSTNWGLQDPSTFGVDIDLDEVKNHYNAKDAVMFDNDFYTSTHSPLVNSMITWHANHKGEHSLNSSWSYNGVVHGFKALFLVYQANILKKKAEYQQDMKYDLVVRMRPDYFFRLNYLQTLNFTVEPDTLYSAMLGAMKYDDQFYYGDSDVMDRVTASFLRTVYMLDKWNSDDTSFNTLVEAFHPNIKVHNFSQRTGVLPNHPVPPEVEFARDLNDIHTRDWAR